MEHNSLQSHIINSDNEFVSISLRPLDQSDVYDLMTWASDEKVASFCKWEPYNTKKKAMNYIKTVVLHHPWFRAICLDSKPIGAVSVTENHGNDRCRGELEFVLGSKYWGKGIATRAVKMAADIVVDERPDLERLEALVDVENVAAQKVLEKAGFQKECVLWKYLIVKGETRDMIMFSLLH